MSFADVEFSFLYLPAQLFVNHPISSNNLNQALVGSKPELGAMANKLIPLCFFLLDTEQPNIEQFAPGIL